MWDIMLETLIWASCGKVILHQNFAVTAVQHRLISASCGVLHNTRTSYVLKIQDPLGTIEPWNETGNKKSPSSHLTAVDNEESSEVGEIHAEHEQSQRAENKRHQAERESARVEIIDEVAIVFHENPCHDEDGPADKGEHVQHDDAHEVTWHHEQWVVHRSWRMRRAEARRGWQFELQRCVGLEADPKSVCPAMGLVRWTSGMRRDLGGRESKVSGRPKGYARIQWFTMWRPVAGGVELTLGSTPLIGGRLLSSATVPTITHRPSMCESGRGAAKAEVNEKREIREESEKKRTKKRRTKRIDERREGREESENRDRREWNEYENHKCKISLYWKCHSCFEKINHA